MSLMGSRTENSCSNKLSGTEADYYKRLINNWDWVCNENFAWHCQHTVKVVSVLHTVHHCHKMGLGDTNNDRHTARLGIKFIEIWH